MTRRVRVSLAVLAVCLVVAAVIVALTRDDDGRAATDRHRGPSAADTTGTTTTTDAAAVTPEPGLTFLPEPDHGNGSMAPLTGLSVADPRVLERPLLAVKIDNLDVPGETARPQTGIAFADVVVEEVVEGGITRFVALVHSTDPPETGPIRSARTTDVQLLPAFGRPLFAYSGGNPGVLAAVRAAPSIIDRGGEWAPAYLRVPTRDAPHNLYVRPWEIWAVPGDAEPPPRLSRFRDLDEPSRLGRPVRGVDIAHSGPAATPVSWEWLPGHRRWIRWQGGSLHVDGEGYAVGPRNVVLVFTDHVTSPADPRSPEARTIGSGAAWVFTDGRVIEGRWQRSDAQSPLSFVDGSDRPISLTQGRTWIELVAPGTANLRRE